MANYGCWTDGVILVPKKNIWTPGRNWGLPKYQKGVLHPVGFWAELGPAYTLDTTAQSPVDVGWPNAEISITWYQVGDGSGRGGEVWAIRLNSADSKLMDWVDPNNQSGDFYVRFSGLSGSQTPTGWTTSWVKIGGTSSANKTLTVSATDPDLEDAFFSVELGTDGSTADEGPTSGWSMEADAQP